MHVRPSGPCGAPAGSARPASPPAAQPPVQPAARPAGRPAARPARRLRYAAGLAALLASSCLLASPAVADPAPPANPTDQQLTDASSQKDALATQVGSLSAKVTELKSRLSQVRLRAELAEQKLADARTKLARAQADAAAAKQQVSAAQASVVKAQGEFSQWVHDTYMVGSVNGMAGSLLTAPDPSALLDRTAYENFVSDNQVSALGDLNRATLAKSNADAAARLAVQKQAGLAQQAQQAEADARASLADAQSASDQVTGQLASTQQQLQDAQATLATLNNQREAYNAWQAEQARIAAEKKAAEEAARRRAEQEAAQRAAAAQAQAAEQAQEQAQAQQQAQQQAQAQAAPAPVADTPVEQSAPVSDGWSSGAARTAVNRARQYLDWPYSYAAGNYFGPTYGVAVDYDSRNDAGVYGFDCSGLVMYAWGPYVHLDHFAATQYWQAGSVHPSVSQLQPGDLVFWSVDGTQAGIGHVAIYIGGGDVIQAPYSGAYIEITPLDDVESGYYGATRPLT